MSIVVDYLKFFIHHKVLAEILASPPKCLQESVQSMYSSAETNI